MMDFLSDVFEFDVDLEDECVQRGPLLLKLCQEKEKTEAGAKGIVFSFKVKSEDEIKEIMSKLNFFLYRKNRGPEDQYDLEKVELEKTDNSTVLTLTDIDQRLWRFELQNRADY